MRVAQRNVMRDSGEVDGEHDRGAGGGSETVGDHDRVSPGVGRLNVGQFQEFFVRPLRKSFH